MIRLDFNRVIGLYLSLKSQYMNVCSCTLDEVRSFSRKLMDVQEVEILVVEYGIDDCFQVIQGEIQILPKERNLVIDQLEYTNLLLLPLYQSGILMNLFIQNVKRTLLEEQRSIVYQLQQIEHLEKSLNSENIRR